MAEERTLSRLNGRRGVSLLVRRQSGENTVAVADAVKARARARCAPSCRPATRWSSRSTPRVFIRSAIRDVGVDIAYGALLAVDRRAALPAQLALDR